MQPKCFGVGQYFMSVEKDKIKIDFGSGYPSDPKTVEFIKKYYDDEKYSKIIRHSWSTVKKLKNNTNQKKLF